MNRLSRAVVRIGAVRRYVTPHGKASTGTQANNLKQQSGTGSISNHQMGEDAKSKYSRQQPKSETESKAHMGRSAGPPGGGKQEISEKKSRAADKKEDSASTKEKKRFPSSENFDDNPYVIFHEGHAEQTKS
jgi:hypothetical protein